MERKLKYLWIGNQQTREPLFKFSWNNELADQTYQQFLEILNKESFSNNLKIIISDFDEWYGKVTDNFLFIILTDQNSEFAFMCKIFGKLERLFRAYQYESDLDISNQNWIRDLWRLKEKYETENKPETIAVIDMKLIEVNLLREINIERPYLDDLSESLEYNYDRINRIDEVSFDTEIYINQNQNRLWKELMPIAIGVIVFLSILGLMLAASASFKPESSHGL
ncbi:unnamed protein product [Blepharisma stoltei]|uniref:Uncharacterized protein n=1 Tax=Blepharisma stoltei TaxID=1481888 RepID=A0AAU9IIH8_9CILI|nr:unnamed protein product [Blepharisma stoltei]